MCHQHDLRQLLPKALHRMAHVIFAIGEMETPELRRNRELRELLAKVSGFLLPEEDPWLRDVIRLRESAPFARLKTVAKAQRMFEVSSLEAERQQDFNTMLESLVEACEIALSRGRPDDVRAYARLARVPTLAFQEELFLALVEIIMADLDLSEGHIDEAIEGYSTYFPILARNRGYGSYLLRDYLERLGRQLLHLPTSQGLNLCDRLIENWTSKELDQEYPELLFQLFEYRNQIQEERT
jgi:hypothetical protein